MRSHTPICNEPNFGTVARKFVHARVHLKLHLFLFSFLKFKSEPDVRQINRALADMHHQAQLGHGGRLLSRQVCQCLTRPSHTTNQEVVSVTDKARQMPHDASTFSGQQASYFPECAARSGIPTRPCHSLDAFASRRRTLSRLVTFSSLLAQRDFLVHPFLSMLTGY